MALSKNMMIMGGVALLVVIIVVVVSVSASGSSQSSAKGESVVANGKVLPTTPGFIPTTQAPTTQAPTTAAPTTRAPTTAAPTQAPALVALVSLEKYTVSEPINLSEIKIYDDQNKLVPASNLKGLATTSWFNVYPVSNLIDGNLDSMAHTDHRTFMMSGGSIGKNVSAQMVAYVPEINDNVFMIVDDGWLKMVNSKNTVAKYVSAGGKSNPVDIFNVKNWNSYNVGAAAKSSTDPGYRVDSVNTVSYEPGFDFKLKNNPAPTPVIAIQSGLAGIPPPVQFMQVAINPPVKVSKIELYNRKDCCQDRINGMVVKTLSPSNNLLSAQPLSGSKMVHTITYNSVNGAITGYSSA
jgi:hypothetical protein